MGRPPSSGWCLIGKVSWGIAQCLKVPEDRAHLYVGLHGWTVLIRDSEFPVPYFEPPTNVQSGPLRQVDPGDERPPDFGEQ